MISMLIRDIDENNFGRWPQESCYVIFILIFPGPVLADLNSCRDTHLKSFSVHLLLI